MELLLLDKNFKAIDVLDTFKSVIWTERYYECGDFEIHIPPTASILESLTSDCYLYLKGSETIMVIETQQITTDVENGDDFILTGRSLESILDRRIVWNQTTLNTDLQSAVRQLINENVISPALSERKIDNFIFETSTDTRITSINVEAQYEVGADLYESIVSLCQAYEVGFKITLTSDNKFNFKLYMGEDRTYNQTANPWVIFSPEFDNVSSTNYLSSYKTYKTVALVGGEGEGSSRKTTIATIDGGAGTNLDRREIFIDVGTISTKVNGKTLSTAEYYAQLEQKGKEGLAENSITQSFEGEMEVGKVFVYGEDFFQGDIVQMVNEYGLETESRVIELVRSQDESGIATYPTFAAVV